MEKLIKRIKELYYPIPKGEAISKIAEINRAQITGYNQAIGRVIELLELPNAFANVIGVFEPTKEEIKKHAHDNVVFGQGAQYIFIDGVEWLLNWQKEKSKAQK